MKFTDLCLVVFLFVVINNVLASNILLLMHIQPSHVAVNVVVGETLVKRGHKVHTIMPETSHQVEKIRKRGINVITFRVSPEELYMDSPEYEDQLSRSIFKPTGNTGILRTIEVTTKHCRGILDNVSIIQEVKRINPDIAIVDPFPLNYCHFLLPYNLSIPYVSIFSRTNFWDIGVPALPSDVPSMSMQTTDKLSFFERVTSAINLIRDNSEYNMFFPKFDDDLRTKFAPSTGSWHDFTKEIIFYAITRDELLERPFPRMPNLRAFPGITYSSTKRLPKEIDTLVTSAKNGVILVSFGSTAGLLPETIFNTFVEVFGKLEGYQIMWKFPARHLKDRDIKQIPSNVHLMSWLPQNDILGHPKTKLFLTHCGNNGIHEALYHGVPMVGFPLFAEQPHNAVQIQNKVYGIALDIHNVTPSQLYASIMNVVSDTTIIGSVKKVSDMIKDRRHHPKEEISDRIESVIKYGGMHLRSVALSLPWYQLFMIDILLCLLGVVLLSGVLILLLCRTMWHLLCQKTKMKNE